MLPAGDVGADSEFETAEGTVRVIDFMPRRASFVAS
jgi:hypothetical protein